MHDWTGLTKDVEEYIAKCEFCQKKTNQAKMLLIITEISNKPFEKCTLNIVESFNDNVRKQIPTHF